MKKTAFITLVFMFVSSMIFAQESPDKILKNENFNEIKINAAFLIAGALEVGYERTINEESAFGISALVSFDEDLKDDIRYYISPYYRFYFGKKYAAGFFVEGFGMLNSIDRSVAFVSASGDDFVTDFALGFGLGGKWVTKRGLSFELIYGIGRNLFNNENTDYELVFKAGVNLGYRF